MANPNSKTTLVTASDAKYFYLLEDFVNSVEADETAHSMALSVLDLGLDQDQADWLRGLGATLVEPGWDFDFPGRDGLPGHFRALLARPFLRRYFPGYDVYISIDADTWVQDGSVLKIYEAAALDGKLAIVPEMDRSYFTMYKRPKLFGWDGAFRAFKFAFGFRRANRMVGKPLCNAGIFALHKNAPHWDLYAENLNNALNRPGRPTMRSDNGGWLIEQSALNHVVYMDDVPVSLLPAYCNWFCALGTPMYDQTSRQLVEPNGPHRPIGIIHLAGKGVQERLFTLPPKRPGDAPVETKLTYRAVKPHLAP